MKQLKPAPPVNVQANKEGGVWVYEWDTLSAEDLEVVDRYVPPVNPEGSFGFSIGADGRYVAKIQYPRGQRIFKP